jgi:Ca2+-binding EF-hand superfamily protein
MDHIRKRVEHRRVLTKPVFQDFDLHNNGHITRTQFRQSFKILEIPIEEPEMHALEARYCNDVGVNYMQFLKDLEPVEPIEFMYIKRMDEIRKTNCKQALPEQRPNSDLESVYLKIKTKVCKERIRIYEFMKDYDKLRSGRMLKTSFRRALNLARLDLYESEVAMLEDKYQSGRDIDFVEYLRFCQDIESIFTTDHLEKNPLEEVTQFKPDEEWTVTVLTEQEEEQLNKCLLRIAEKVYKHRMQLFPLFEDYDRVHNGAVSQSQFRRVLMELELAKLAADTDIELLWRKYQFQVGGRTDINYIAFCEKIYELSGFEYRKP